MNPLHKSAIPKIAPYGAWKSPISADAILADSVKLGSIAIAGDTVWWTEGRPQEAGRTVLMRAIAEGEGSDITLAPFDVRSRVHEYGGAAFTLHEDTVYFVNARDQAVYCQGPGAEPQFLAGSPQRRYADGVIDAARRRLILVREDHAQGAQEPVNTLVAVKLEAPHQETLLLSGADFYASPSISPDGNRIAWLSWQHPNMPWDGTTLSVGRFAEDGSITDIAVVAGGTEESIFQPQWSPGGELVFASDRSGWWNLYRWRDGDVQALHALAAEFGRPQWQFGMSTFGFEPCGSIVCVFVRDGASTLARLKPDSGALQIIDTPYRDIEQLRVGDGFAAFIGGAPSQPKAIVRFDLASGRSRVLRASSALAIDARYRSAPQAIEFPTEGGRTAHAFFYPAHNDDFAAPADTGPPLLVLSHGGPTSSTDSTLNPSIQFWTSRGFGVVDVNYGGSTGYGRDYRRRLKGQWGIVDVDDCVNAARYLVARGLADRKRLAIRGGSAGGYTTLSALAFRDYFSAGASYYGVGDLEVLARDTHKFESRYLDSLVGPYPAQKALYEARSPINAVDRLSSPMILFQGLEDKVVPPNQAQLMFEAVRAKGLPVAYLAFEHEQHGFRAAATIKRCLEAELYFYGKVFGFTPADRIAPVPIENLALH